MLAMRDAINWVVEDNGGGFACRRAGEHGRESFTIPTTVRNLSSDRLATPAGTPVLRTPLDRRPRSMLTTATARRSG